MKSLLLFMLLILTTACTSQEKELPQKKQQIMNEKTNPNAKRSMNINDAFNTVHELEGPSIQNWVLEQSKDWDKNETRKAVYFRINGSRMHGNKSYVSSNDVQISQESNGSMRRVIISYKQAIQQRKIEVTLYYNTAEDAPGTYKIEANSHFYYLESMSMDDYHGSSKDHGPLDGEINLLSIDDNHIKGTATFLVPKIVEEGSLAGKTTKEYENVKVEVGFCTMQL